MRICLMTLTVSALLASPAFAWWDTQIMMAKDPPTVMEIEAERASPAGAEVIADTPPYGPEAGGGKAVVLKPGAGTLTFKTKLPRSIYVLFVIARVAEADPVKNQGQPEWPMSGQLKVTGPDGKAVGEWSLPFSYLNTYYDTSRLYFPANVEGAYTLEYSLAPESKANLAVDRLEIRDALGLTMKKGFKKGRNLFTDEEVAAIRKKNNAPAPGQELRLDPARAAERIEAFRKRYATGYAEWNAESGGIKDPFRQRYGLPLPGATAYLEKGDTKAAQDVAETLIYWADRYPAIDKTAQNVDPQVPWNCLSRGVRFTFTDSRFGGFWYSGHETGIGTTILASYDYVFPYIQANAEEFAAMAQLRVPWVKTAQDLIDYLDTRLVQYIGDRVNRRFIRAAEGGSESVMLMAAQVQGPNPAGERMMRWLFTNTYMDSCNDGGIQDHAVTSFFRDGCNLIGSIGYTAGSAGVLIRAAKYTRRFAAQGGNREFDLSDISRFPAIIPGAFLPLESRLAGGYQANVGDWDRPFNNRKNDTLAKVGDHNDPISFAWEQTRDPRMAWLLVNVVRRTTESDDQWSAIERAAAGQRDPQLSSVSRNLRGFGLAILESGSETDDIIRKSALAFRHGIGKGHAHADSLNIEYFTQGARLIPDAGSRGGRPHPGDMSAHLGVCVDGKAMHNSEVNTSGTAWTEAFVPAHGASYVAGAARFNSVPQVSRYQRQAALIEIAGASGTEGTYVFDVLRVTGGKSHVWNMHGPAATDPETFTYSLALAPAASEAARRILTGHLNPREGTVGDTLISIWPLARGYEERMMGPAFNKDLPPIIARSTLFGHRGDRAYIGASDPKQAGLEGVAWDCAVGLVHVARSAESDGLQTVWPQIIEGYRGQALIATARQLATTPEDQTASAPVALAVETTTGQKDTLVADGDGHREIKAGNVTLQGRFGYLSYDAKGLRLAHLVGGAKLTDGALTIEAKVPGYAARIAGVDYANRRIVLDTDWPDKMLDGQELLTGLPAHPQAWQVTRCSGKTLTMDHSPLMYQSEILTVDEQAGEIICSINPPFLSADDRYYDGVTASDESGRRAWRVKAVRPKYIWMYLQEPVQDWRRLYSDDDFPANAQGKRMVKITNWGGGDGIAARPEIALEVARVDKARQVIYFHLPDDEEIVRASGWSWAGSRLNDPARNRWLITGRGRKIQSNYVGKTNVIKLEGPVKDGDFKDTDHDGRRVLRLYHYGVGDSVFVPSHVVVSRQDDGSYKLEASTSVTVALGDGTKLTR